MKRANSYIRELMRKKGVPTYAVAEVMGVHENTVFRRLRFELSEEDKNKFIQIINEIAKNNEDETKK